MLLRVLPYGDVSVGYYLNRDGIVNKLALPRYVITSLQRDAGSGSNELPPGLGQLFGRISARAARDESMSGNSQRPEC